MKTKGLIFFILVHASMAMHAQNDSIPVNILDTVTVITNLKRNFYLAITEGVNVFAGKKTNVLYEASMGGNLAASVQRTAFAKIPGLRMWEMDGAGTQLI